MTEIADDRVKLSADGIVHLYKIELRAGGTVRVKSDNDATWQGNLYEGTLVEMSGYKRTSDEEVTRPTLTLANPDHILTVQVNLGNLEKSIVTHYMVLYNNLINNLNIYEQDSWYISRVVGVTDIAVVCELRNPIDGPNILTPARMYIPPEFPAVSLS